MTKQLSKSERRNAGIVRIALTSFLTEESSWSRAAANTPDLSRERYRRLARIANAVVKARPKPRYVLFPELAIPRRWVRTLAHHFLKEGISLITGVEYARSLHDPDLFVLNEARLYLTDNRLGFPSYCVLTQRKGIPAHHERAELRSRFGLALAPVDASACKKRVYRHFGFNFGLLICSELTDLAHRKKMRGRVDNLFVLSWNQDLESFAALVESSAIDVHCFMTLVNNRQYGDSRVRAPFKDLWRRDVVRVKGGVDDYFVVAEIDVRELREFQSNRESPDSPFKPLPDGYVISPRRYTIPGA
jgi:hypothetical protein